jgi:predicted nucleic-acid-binding Zn-ribbon protein
MDDETLEKAKKEQGTIKLQDNIENGKVYLDKYIESIYKTYADNLISGKKSFSVVDVEKPTDYFLDKAVDILNKEFYELSKYYSNPKHIILNKNDPKIRNFVLETGIAYSTFMDMQWKRMIDLIRKRCGYSENYLVQEIFHFSIDDAMLEIGKAFDYMAETRRKSESRSIYECTLSKDGYTDEEVESHNHVIDDEPTDDELFESYMKDLDQHQDELDNPSSGDLKYAAEYAENKKYEEARKKQNSKGKIVKFKSDK